MPRHVTSPRAVAFEADLANAKRFAGPIDFSFLAQKLERVFPLGGSAGVSHRTSSHLHYFLVMAQFFPTFHLHPVGTARYIAPRFSPGPRRSSPPDGLVHRVFVRPIFIGPLSLAGCCSFRFGHSFSSAFLWADSPRSPNPIASGTPGPGSSQAPTAGPQAACALLLGREGATPRSR
jgi:hypothetical protein